MFRRPACLVYVLRHASRHSKTPHYRGCAPRLGAMTQIRTRPRFLYNAPTVPLSFIILCLLVRKLSCWQTHPKLTNKQTPLKTSNDLRYATTLGKDQIKRENSLCGRRAGVIQRSCRGGLDCETGRYEPSNRLQSEWLGINYRPIYNTALAQASAGSDYNSRQSCISCARNVSRCYKAMRRPVQPLWCTTHRRYGLAATAALTAYPALRYPVITDIGYTSPH